MDGPVVRPLVWGAPYEVVFLTCDLGSFDPEAENTCERLMNLALEIDENNFEALQTLASFRLSQQKPDEAREFLERAWSGWKDLDSGTF